MVKLPRSITDSRPGKFAASCLRRYFVHDVGRQSAALAYYLLFAIFPFLIFISSLLGLLQLDISSIVSALTPLLPGDVVAIVETYLQYVSHTSSPTILWFSLVFSIYFPMRAAGCLMAAVRRAYHLPQPARPLLYQVKVLLYTVFLLLTIAMTLVLATVGQRALRFLEDLFHIPPAFSELWITLRFVVMGVVVFAAVGLLYAMAQDRRRSGWDIVPGAIFSLAAWIALSALYSFYVENFSNYSVIYGTLGTVIVLLIWLSLTATILIFGAEINATIIALRDVPRRKKAAKGSAAKAGETGGAAPSKER